MRRGTTSALFLVLAMAGCQAAADQPVRKAMESGICHDAASSNYKRLKHYTEYPTLAACLEAGGRLSAGATPPSSKTTRSPGKAVWDTDDRTIVKKSRSGICYDASDGRFDRTLHFTAYRTMRDCLEDGGRPPE